MWLHLVHRNFYLAKRGQKVKILGHLVYCTNVLPVSIQTMTSVWQFCFLQQIQIWIYSNHQVGTEYGYKNSAQLESMLVWLSWSIDLMWVGWRGRGGGGGGGGGGRLHTENQLDTMPGSAGKVYVGGGWWWWWLRANLVISFGLAST